MSMMSKGDQGRRGARGAQGLQGPPVAGKITLSFAAVVVFSFLILASMTVQVRKNRALSRQGVNAHAALCVFRHDLERRADAGDVFLHLHPNGIPGIDAVTIKESLKNQRATLRGLAILNCT